MPDSALTTYFGKPAFHAYGNGNTNPGQGGLIYGDYMKTHSINPHSGDNKPDMLQCYTRAMRGQQEIVKQTTGSKADRKKIVMEPKRKRVPEPPRQAPLKRPLTAAALKEQMGRLAVMPVDADAKQHFKITKPAIEPDLQIAHEQMLDQAQGKAIKVVPSEAEMKAISSRRSQERSARSKLESQKNLESAKVIDSSGIEAIPVARDTHGETFDAAKELAQMQNRTAK